MTKKQTVLEIGSEETPSLAKQFRLGKFGTLVLINLIAMAPPLCTDMYAPALPIMTVELASTESTMSLTMSLFFFFMAVGMLVIGPISDRFGRKTMTLVCVLASFLCSFIGVFVTSAEPLVVLRCLQAVGAGGMVTLSMALVRDCYTGERMARMLAICQAISMFAPAVAPLIGVVALQFLGWRGILAVQAALMGIAALGTFLLVETLEPEHRISGNVFQSFAGLIPYARNAKMVCLLIIGGLMNAPLIAYLTLSSYIYIDFYSTGETLYGIIFAITAMSSVAGAFTFARFTDAPPRKCMGVALVFCVIVTVGMVLLGLGGSDAKAACFTFMGLMVVYLFVITFMRPLIAALIMREAEKNAGAASAIANFAFNAIGCFGMVVAGLSFWSNNVIAVGGALVVVTAVEIVVWLGIRKRVN